jgi:hypothetical protein
MKKFKCGDRVKWTSLGIEYHGMVFYQFVNMRCGDVAVIPDKDSKRFCNYQPTLYFSPEVLEKE